MGRKSNPYFQFKQFTVFHDRCAMKVGTDGTVLGAWVDLEGARQILDIGTGTGLIALMLAQRSQAVNSVARSHLNAMSAPIDSVTIDAVELDAAACLQAQENVRRSPWADRIYVHHDSIQDYVSRCSQTYDLVVSNPPFFENVSKAQSEARTLARHTDSLSPTDLLQSAAQLLNATGRLAAIYPCEAAQRFQEQAEAAGFWCSRKLAIKPTLAGATKRIAMEFSKSKIPNRQDEVPQCLQEKIAIEVAPNQYTPEFIALIRDFYLKY